MFVCVVFLLCLCAQTFAADNLATGFANPPESARPWVYWFWLNGNITKIGITEDLEAMARNGIGGVLIMEVDQGAPVGDVPFASEKWRELFKFMVSEAARLGIKVNMNNDAGWNGSGGPWMPVELSMQKITTSEVQATGGQQVSATLPMPPVVANYYKDIAVLAFPTPAQDYRLEDIAGKAAFVRRDIGPLPAKHTELKKEQCIALDTILDISDKITAEGNLTWEAPAGNWTILRIGHTSTGAQNAPAPESGRGLEADKLSAEAVEFHYNHLIGQLVKDSPQHAGTTFVATHIDSWENGSQNWTPLFREEFLRLRGYDCLPYLPVISGRVVGNLEQTERFLYDLRLTVSDLLLKNYAGHMRELANRDGLRLTIEAYGDTTVDNLAYAGICDEPMGEFWASPPFGAGGSLTEMASAAHVSGQPIVGAESFTSGDAERWLLHPGNIKSMGDWAFCLGINRFVFHRYALQPWKDRQPGMSMGPWGLHYERSQTWWEQSGPWHEYLARCQYLLQQGLPVVDVLYLAPEGAPRSFNPPADAIRRGYKADACSPLTFLERAFVKNGRIIFPDGMSYRVLVLPGAETMSPELTRRIVELADAGATIIGNIPQKSVGLTDSSKADEAITILAQQLKKSNRIIQNKSPEDVLRGLKILPDFTSDRAFDFIHKKLDNAEVYFVANYGGHGANAQCSFRISGLQPEIWIPETGERIPVISYSQSGGQTHMPLRLEANQSVFVIFKQAISRQPIITNITRLGSKPEQVWPVKAAAAPVTILKALWGPEGDTVRVKDVTAQVQRKVDQGLSSFIVAELAVEGDPAFGVVKRLNVEYQVGDKTLTTTATDAELIIFEMPSDAPSAIQISATQAGKLSAEVLATGRYQVSTASGSKIEFSARRPQLMRLDNDWQLAFPPNWGAPAQVQLNRLMPWNEHDDFGVRHFSGTATYQKTVTVTPEFIAKGRKIYLDLGKVEIMAQVTVNGEKLPLLWKPPYRIEITPALKSGDNEIEIAVTNLWINRMIGDEYLPEDSPRPWGNGTMSVWPQWLADEDAPSPTGRFTFTSWRLWGKDSPLQPSGIIGPVTLKSVETLELEGLH